MEIFALLHQLFVKSAVLTYRKGERYLFIKSICSLCKRVGDMIKQRECNPQRICDLDMKKIQAKAIWIWTRISFIITYNSEEIKFGTESSCVILAIWIKFNPVYKKINKIVNTKTSSKCPESTYWLLPVFNGKVTIKDWPKECSITLLYLWFEWSAFARHRTIPSPEIRKYDIIRVCIWRAPEKMKTRPYTRQHQLHTLGWGNNGS